MRLIRHPFRVLNSSCFSFALLPDRERQEELHTASRWISLRYRMTNTGRYVEKHDISTWLQLPAGDSIRTGSLSKYSIPDMWQKLCWIRPHCSTMPTQYRGCHSLEKGKVWRISSCKWVIFQKLLSIPAWLVLISYEKNVAQEMPSPRKYDLGEGIQNRRTKEPFAASNSTK